jgi:hypothetical protein
MAASGAIAATTRRGAAEVTIPAHNRVQGAGSGDGLAEILERVLDRGVVIAGDVSVSLVGVELLTIRLRLLIASVDKAKEMGIDWWTVDPALSSQARRLAEENDDLKARLAALESKLAHIEA